MNKAGRGRGYPNAQWPVSPSTGTGTETRTPALVSISISLRCPLHTLPMASTSQFYNTVRINQYVA